jgi:hypothetical protein
MHDGEKRIGMLEPAGMSQNTALHRSTTTLESRDASLSSSMTSLLQGPVPPCVGQVM